MLLLSPRVARAAATRAAAAGATAARAAHTRADAATLVPALQRPASDSSSPSTPRSRPPRVVVGMSGGVDSSVSAYLLKARGFDVVGLHMVNWDEADETGHRGRRPCAVSQQEYADVRTVCARLGVPAHQCNFVQDYWNDVFAPMLDGYDAGITPNPDVLCNRHIKFDAFLRHAVEVLGADYVATGHYARTDSAGRLIAGVDRDKDQSYFLCGVEAAALRGDASGGIGGSGRVLFPCGALRKEQVRRIARVAGLAEVAEKKDSYGICFVGKRNFAEFIAEYVPLRPGRFVSVEDGSTVGPPEGHQGFATYTVGQGARISGAAQKWYVVDKRVMPADAAAGGRLGGGALSHDVVVAQGRDHPALFADVATVRADTFNWVAGTPPEPLLTAGASMRVQSRVRYRQELEWCTVSLQWCESIDEENEGSGVSGGDSRWLRLVAQFDEPQFAVAPGQILALYDGDVCLGGGAVVERFRRRPVAEEEQEEDDAGRRAWWIPVWPDGKEVTDEGGADNSVPRSAAVSSSPPPPHWSAEKYNKHVVALSRRASLHQRRMYHASAPCTAKGTPGERPRKKLSKRAYAKKKSKGSLTYRERMEMELGESGDGGDQLIFDLDALDSFDTVQSGILVMDDGFDGDAYNDNEFEFEFAETDGDHDDRSEKLRSRKQHRKGQLEARRDARRVGTAVHDASATATVPRSTATDQPTFRTSDPHDLRALLDMLEPSNAGDSFSPTSAPGYRGRRRQHSFQQNDIHAGTALGGGGDPVAEAARIERRLRAPALLPVHDRVRERSRKNLLAAARLRDDIVTMLESGRVQLNAVVHNGGKQRKNKKRKKRKQERGTRIAGTVVIDSSEVDVVDVELSPDMRNATVWWTAPTHMTLSAKEREAVTAALSKCSYKLRMTIAKARRMRVAPRLEWRDDHDRLRNLRKLEGLLDEVKARLDAHDEDDSSLDEAEEEYYSSADGKQTRDRAETSDADGKPTTDRAERLVLEDL